MAEQTRSIDKKPAFLAAFAIRGSITHAARAVGLDRGEHYDWLKKDPEYASAFESARVLALKTLRDGAVRAVGDPKPIIGKPRASMTVAARERDGFRCKVCGFEVGLNVHHIVARCDGGPDELENLVCLCPNHHALAHLGLLGRAELLDLIKTSVDPAKLRLRVQARIRRRVREYKQKRHHCDCGL